MDWRRAAARLAAMTSGKRKAAMPINRKTKFGDMVPVNPGMRTFSVDANKVRPRKAANSGRLGEDHDFAARTTITVPEARMRAMYALAVFGIEDSLSTIYPALLLGVPVVADPQGLQDGVAPNHGISPDHAERLVKRIAPDYGVAPNHGFTGDERTGEDRIAPDNRVTPNDGVVPDGRGV